MGQVQNEKYCVQQQWIQQHATAHGGYTRRQLAILGVGWPPAPGWQVAAVGRQISDAARAAFEAMTVGSRGAA